MSGLPEAGILDLDRRQIYPRGDRLGPDFLVERAPILDRDTPIASIGSCFASRVKVHLQRSDFNYVVTSDHPAARPTSAAWGDVFNTFCMRQEIERTLRSFDPAVAAWRSGGRLLSPYRKGVEWSDESEMRAERDRHVRDAHDALKEAEVLVITLGLTEIWYSDDDGAVFYQVPPEDVFEPARHAFRNSSVDENLHNLGLIRMLLKAFGEPRIIVTVSPVPLRATFEDRNVVVASSFSKSKLVAAAQRFAYAHDDVHYFPSYELVTALIPRPFKGDNRHVTPETEAAVMDLFERSFVR